MQEDDDLQYVLRMLADSNLKAIARNVDLTYMQVWKIASGTVKDPAYSQVKKLADYFRNKK